MKSVVWTLDKRLAPGSTPEFEFEIMAQYAMNSFMADYAVNFLATSRPGQKACGGKGPHT